MEQKELFEEIVKMKHRIQSLASYVQNDFDVIINECGVTKDELKDSLVYIDKDYDRFIEDLNHLRERSKTMIKELVWN